jgi:phage-related protein
VSASIVAIGLLASYVPAPSRRHARGCHVRYRGDTGTDVHALDEFRRESMPSRPLSDDMLRPLQRSRSHSKPNAGCQYAICDIFSMRVSAEKPLVWLSGEVKTPPFSAAGRVKAGVLLRRLQGGELLALPHSRPMPSVGRRCHELRIVDEAVTWRIMYRIDSDAIIILAVFRKTTRETPKHVIDQIQRRLRAYDAAVEKE